MKIRLFRTPEVRYPSDQNPASGTPVNLRRTGIACAVTFAAIALFGLFVPMGMTIGGGTFTVTNVADNTSGNTTAGSLRDGISAANSGACASPCTIQFGTTGNITLFSALPTITAAGLTVNGYTATGAVTNTAAFGSAISANLPVQVTTTNGTPTAFDITASNVTIKGLVISGFSTRAVRLGGTGAVVAGCFIGTNSSGTASFSPAGTVGIEVIASGATIGGSTPADRNLISGNSTAGVYLNTGSVSTTVIGNYIGTDKSGTAATTGQPIGVRVSTSSNAIGTALAPNVISGNTAEGVLIDAGSGNTVKANRIGTNALGTGAVANGTGVLVGGASLPIANTIGGSFGEGNLISGNTNYGVQVSGAGGSTAIAQNTLGVSVTNTAVPNGTGISLSSAGSANTISANEIGGNSGDAIAILGATNTSINSNDIGIVNAVTAGNGGRGIYVSSGSAITISSNTIQNNTGNGIDIDGPTGVNIYSNAVSLNGTVGIDLHASAINSGPTANDVGDADTGGGNNLQNYPLITSAYLNGLTTSATLTATFNVDSASVGTTQSISVDLYEADSSTNPEGKRWLQQGCFAGNSLSGKTLTVPSANLTPGSKVVATATSYSNVGCGTVNDGTSEFSLAATTAVQPGIVITTNDSGAGSLRQAITDANTGTCTSPCTITFNIPNTDPNFSGGVYTIKPLSQLPYIRKSNTTLDGSTQTAFGGNTNASGPEIVISGASAGSANGLGFDALTAGEGANLTIANVTVNGFTGNGIYVAGSVPLTSPKIIGCYIGTNPTGTAAVPNTQNGIFVTTNSISGTQIGTAGNGNLISGNGNNGIYLSGAAVTSTSILANTIGMNAAKTFGIANADQGILIDNGSSSAVIGNTGTGGNIIAFNGMNGVAINNATSTLNEIRGNSIYSNTQLAIDLGLDGVTANDANDVDTGANNLQNFPVLTSAVYNCGPNQTVITGTLNSIANTTFDIDWYTNTSVDASGNGEGQTYQGTSTWVTDGTGNTNVSIVLAGDVRASFVTATASRVVGANRETSEFSAPAPAFNNAPVASNDTLTVLEDVAAGSVNVIANDTDAECSTVTVSSNTQPANGTVSCTTAGICSYTPNTNFNGADFFTYIATDGANVSSSAVVSITVTAVNDVPSFVPGAAVTINEDSGAYSAPWATAISAGPPDEAGQTLTFAATNNNNALFSVQPAIAANGTLTFTPAPNANGTATVTVKLSDNGGVANGGVDTTSAVTLSITVNAVNDAPSFTSGGNVTVAEDSGAYLAPWAASVSAGPIDEAGQTLTFTVTNNNNALFSVQPSLNSAGHLAFTPAPNANGSATVSATLFDNGGGTNSSAPQTFTINVTAVNDPPVANTDTVVTNEDTTVAVNVLTNDTDADLDTLTVVGSTNGTKGTVTCAASGACTYVPNADQNGADSFTYTLFDGTTTVIGTVNVTITPVNDPPTAAADTYTAAGNSTLTVAAPGVLGNDIDVDGPSLTATVLSGATHGIVSLNTDGSFSYTPTANYSGPDAFTYTVSDGSFSSNATVSITVAPAFNSADLSLAITDSPDPVTAGNGVNYTVTVTNNGPNTNSAYSLTLTLTGGTVVTVTSGTITCTPNAGGAACTGTAIAAGGTQTATLTATAGTGATMQLAGTISYAVDPNTANNAATQSTVITASADVQIVKNSTSALIAGQATTYSITVTNNGASDAIATTVHDTAPAGLTFVSNSGGCTSTFPCSLGTLTSGQTVTITSTYNVAANATGTIANSANVTTTTNDPNTANNSSTATGVVTSTADVGIAKSGPASVAPGGTVSYSIAVTNNGPSDATAVNVADTTPAGLTFVSNSGACTNAFPCALGTLIPGQIATITSTYTVAANATGTITNTATASATNDSSPANNTSSTSAAVSTNADVAIAKSGPASAQPNTNVTYTITVTNNGPAIATGVNVADPTPSRLTFVSATGACATFPCAIGTMTAGQTKTITATYTVTAGPSTTITNTASVTATSPDPNGANNSSSTSMSSGCPAVALNASPADGQQNVGTSGTLHWSNTGATSYNVYLGASGSGCSTLLGTTSGTSMNFSGLTGGAFYEWRVESVGFGCPTRSTSCLTFSTSATCPTSGAALIAPANGSLQSSPVVFSWTAVANTTQYHVFASVGGASSVEIGATSATTLTANVGDGSVTWFVVADVAGCAPLQSQSGSFNACNIASPVAGVVAEALSGQTYDVSWVAVPGATKYEIDEASNAAFSGAQTKSVTTTSVSYQHNALTSAQPFFYRVRAFSSCRQQFGDYSDTIRIVIATLPPADRPNPNINVPAGSKRVVVQQVFVPGFPDGTFPFTARVDKDWLQVTPSSGILPPSGITLTVTADPSSLPNGTFTGTVIVTVLSNTSTSTSLKPAANRTSSFPVSVSLVTPVVPTAPTSPVAASLIIPSIGHIDGFNSHWQSDIRVANTLTQKVHYQLIFTPAGSDPSKKVQQTTIEIDGNATTALDDIVRNWYGIGALGETAMGVLEIRPLDAPTTPAPADATDNLTSSFTVSTVASSRTYNTTTNGTLGQYTPAIPFGNFIGRGLNNAQQPQVLSLQQVAQSDAYRTNIGVVEASGKPVSLMLTVFAASGARLLDYPVSLNGGEMRQLNGFLAENGLNNVTDARVEVKVLEGEGKVTAYASVVDNHTNDPLLVSGVPLGSVSADRYVLPGVADINNGFASWRTDARIFNSGSTQQAATLTFYPQGNVGSPTAKSVIINPGEVRTLDNILNSFFGITSDDGTANLGGALHVSTPGASSLIVTGRTYNKTSDGTFGQFIPAVTAADSIGSAQRALQILQVEESPRFRTNLGLAEVTGKPAHVEVTVNLPDSKVSPRIDFMMQPNEFRQFGIINELGLGNTYNARISVKVLDGDGKITAYGAVIDRQTQDPTYVPAQ
jgi:uncharacterized repeat protein (TIGR01451 family)